MSWTPRRKRESETSNPTETSTPAGAAPRGETQGHATARGQATVRTAPDTTRTAPTPTTDPPRRRGVAWRTREAGASAVGTAGAGVLLLARLVMTAAGLIALLIALAIVLRDVEANAANSIVKGIHEGANFFAGAFSGLISFQGHPKREITVDWGIALLVYLLVGGVLARTIARIGYGGLRFERRHRSAPSH